jgi:hypothetical protein
VSTSTPSKLLVRMSLRETCDPDLAVSIATPASFRAMLSLSVFTAPDWKSSTPVLSVVCGL